MLCIPESTDGELTFEGFDKVEVPGMGAGMLEPMGAVDSWLLGGGTVVGVELDISVKDLAGSSLSED